MNTNYNIISIKLKLHWLKLFCVIQIFYVKSCLFRSQYILGNDENCSIVLVPKIVLCDLSFKILWTHDILKSICH